MRELELYIHIPFCVRKCEYCDFLSAPAPKEERDRYVRTLLEEIRGGMPISAPAWVEPDDYMVTSVFWGGGTPSLLDASQISEIMEALRARFRFSENAEVTMECNPGTVDEEKLRLLCACGINRVSFGLQSADNEELKCLGRIHTWEMFLETYETARRVGFTNINIDLMSALPGQTAESWKQTLQKILTLAPEHISAYSLIIEEGTPFYQRYHEDDVRREKGEPPLYLPSEDEERRMYILTDQLLSKAGLFRYEISNYALPGYECRHNIGYWRGIEYMGFGLGASSLLRYPNRNQLQENQSCSEQMKSVRLKNPTDANVYRQGVEGRNTDTLPAGVMEETAAYVDPDMEILSANDEMAEFMFLGLRMMCGVSEQEFIYRFGCSLDSVYGDSVSRMVALGLLQRENGLIFLTSHGIDLSNQVMAEFIL